MSKPLLSLQMPIFVVGGDAGFGVIREAAIGSLMPDACTGIRRDMRRYSIEEAEQAADCACWPRCRCGVPDESDCRCSDECVCEAGEGWVVVDRDGGRWVEIGDFYEDRALAEDWLSRELLNDTMEAWRFTLAEAIAMVAEGIAGTDSSEANASTAAGVSQPFFRPVIHAGTSRRQAKFSMEVEHVIVFPLRFADGFWRAAGVFDEESKVIPGHATAAQAVAAACGALVAAGWVADGEAARARGDELLRVARKGG